MPDILHGVGIKSTLKKVFEAISTIEGISHWWVVDTSGNDKVGGNIRFRCEGGSFDFKVVQLKPNKLVKWKCLKGPKEWIGTEMTFELKLEAGQVFVLFTHGGWKKPTEFMHHCSTKWAVFLLSLRDWVERGEGHPSPYDVKIGVGH
jgi:uncharacterized protein YndB with AHSA1/START domain